MQCQFVIHFLFYSKQAYFINKYKRLQRQHSELSLQKKKKNIQNFRK